MKKLTPFLIGCLIAIGAAACQDVSKTSSEAPNNVNEAAEAPAPQATEAALEDAQSELRRRQLNEDIRASEQRNNIFNDGKATGRDENNLESEVRSKLEANIPNSHLAIAAEENGKITVTGTVTNQAQLDKIEPLAKEIKGVTTVVNQAVVAQAKTGADNNKTQ